MRFLKEAQLEEKYSELRNQNLLLYKQIPSVGLRWLEMYFDTFICIIL